MKYNYYIAIPICCGEIMDKAFITNNIEDLKNKELYVIAIKILPDKKIEIKEIKTQ